MPHLGNRFSPPHEIAVRSDETSTVPNTQEVLVKQAKDRPLDLELGCPPRCRQLSWPAHHHMGLSTLGYTDFGTARPDTIEMGKYYPKACKVNKMRPSSLEGPRQAGAGREAAG